MLRCGVAHVAAPSPHLSARLHGANANLEMHCWCHPPSQPGDKIVEISASFGSEVWKAENFGQIMYAIRTRSGTVYMKIKRNYGDLTALEVCRRAADAGDVDGGVPWRLHPLGSHVCWPRIIETPLQASVPPCASQEEGLDAAEKQWKKERAGGNYGAGTKEIQARGYGGPAPGQREWSTEGKETRLAEEAHAVSCDRTGRP